MHRLLFIVIIFIAIIVFTAIFVFIAIIVSIASFGCYSLLLFLLLGLHVI